METLNNSAIHKITNYYKFSELDKSDSLKFLFSNLYFERVDTEQIIKNVNDVHQIYGHVTNFSIFRYRIRKALATKDKKEVLTIFCKALHDKDSTYTEDTFSFTIYKNDSLGNIDELTISDWSMNN